MKIQVLLFASLKDAVGSDHVELSAEGPLTSDQLVSAIAAQEPSLAPHLEHVRIAVDQAFCDPDTVIDESSEVALIPPVSGG